MLAVPSRINNKKVARRKSWSHYLPKTRSEDENQGEDTTNNGRSRSHSLQELLTEKDPLIPAQVPDLPQIVITKTKTFTTKKVAEC